MLKKIMSLLFEEEEIIEEEEIVKPPLPPVKKVIAKHEPMVQLKPEKKMEPVQPEVVEEVKPVLKRIDVEPMIKPVKKPAVPQKEIKPYEFQDVISPIFGKSHKEAPVGKTIQPELPVESEKSVLGTIISPIYGINKKDKAKKPEPPVAKSVEHLSLEDLMGLSVEEEFEQKQLPLDEPTPDLNLFSELSEVDSKESL